MNKDANFTFRINAEKLEHYRKCAKEANRSLSNWIEQILDEEVKRQKESLQDLTDAIRNSLTRGRLIKGE